MSDIPVLLCCYSIVYIHRQSFTSDDNDKPIGLVSHLLCRLLWMVKIGHIVSMEIKDELGPDIYFGDIKCMQDVMVYVFEFCQN